MARINTGLRIDSGEIDAEFTKLKEVAPEDYYALMCKRRSFLHHSIAHDCRCLLQFVEDASQMFGPLGFADADDFIARGLELDPEQVRWALDGLHRLRPQEACSFEKAITLGKWGGDHCSQKFREEKQSSPTTLLGRGKQYQLARLRAEYPHFLEAYKRGEYRTVKAAAIAAGIVKVKTPFEQLCSWWKKATPEERQSFLKEIIDAKSTEEKN